MAKIKVITTQGWIEVEGFTYENTFAIHRALTSCKETFWTITHIGTGCSIMSVVDKRNAGIKAIKAVLKELPNDSLFRTSDDMGEILKSEECKSYYEMMKREYYKQLDLIPYR